MNYISLSLDQKLMKTRILPNKKPKCQRIWFTWINISVDIWEKYPSKYFIICTCWLNLYMGWNLIILVGPIRLRQLEIITISYFYYYWFYKIIELFWACTIILDGSVMTHWASFFCAKTHLTRYPFAHLQTPFPVTLQYLLCPVTWSK